MRSTFFGLEIGNRALAAQQRALDVVGHNVANANTVGYSRQDAIMATTYPDLQPSTSQRSSYTIVGTGVAVNDIARVRNDFYDQQYRDQNVKLGESDTLSSELQKLELVFNGGSDTGLSTIYDQFWQSWQELNKNPESLTTRAVVRQQGEALADNINQMYSQIKDSLTNLEQTLDSKVVEINSYADQIKQLNQQIVNMEGGGNKANDLRDKRDQIIDKLSNDINVRVSDSAQGIRISVGDYDLVDGQEIHQIKLGPDIPNRGLIQNQLQWASTGQSVEVTGGEVSGILKMRDNELPNYIQQLDDLVDATVQHTNQYQIEGYGLTANGVSSIVGGTNATWSAVTVDPANTKVGEWKVVMSDATNFDLTYRDINGSWQNEGSGQLGTAFSIPGEVSFTINGTAQSGDTWTFTTVGGQASLGAPLFFNPSDKNNFDTVMSMNSALQGDDGLQKIAASQLDGEEGNGDNALRIAGLNSEKVMSGNAATFNEFINKMVSNLGVDTQQYKNSADNQTTLLAQIDNQRQSISSVSMDEEMANMVKFQQSYNASARIITSVDETLNTIINSMGLVGRG